MAALRRENLNLKNELKKRDDKIKELELALRSYGREARRKKERHRTVGEMMVEKKPFQANRPRMANMEEIASLALAKKLQEEEMMIQLQMDQINQMEHAYQEDQSEEFC
jgi:hypothetical protein